MKCHVQVYVIPPPRHTEGLCGEKIANAREVIEMSGDVVSVREMLSDFRGLCRTCKKMYFGRSVEIGREWLYLLAEGQEVESQL